MNVTPTLKRLTAAALLGTFALATVAPAAEAKQKYKGNSRHRGGSHYESRVIARHYSRPRYVVRESDSWVPALAGFVGGLVVGSAISNRSHESDYYEPEYREVRYRPRYAYYDPYCDHRYASLEVSVGHFSGCHHPRVIQVIDVSSGRCIDRYAYSGGGWRDYDDRYAYDSGYGDDRGSCDD